MFAKNNICPHNSNLLFLVTKTLTVNGLTINLTTNIKVIICIYSPAILHSSPKNISQIKGLKKYKIKPIGAANTLKIKNVL